MHFFRMETRTYLYLGRLSKIPLGVYPKGLPLGYTPALAFF